MPGVPGAEPKDYGVLTVIHSLRRVWFEYRRKLNGSPIRRRRGRTLPLSTRQWLILTFGIAILVGAIFILALYYQPGR